MPPSRRDKRAGGGSCYAGASDQMLLTLFHEIDHDCNGYLSIPELGRALQTNKDFARICTGKAEAISAIAAGLIAQNIRNIADTEFGEASDGDGTVSPDEFILLCRRLMGEPVDSAASAPCQSSRPSSSSSASQPKQSALRKSTAGMGGFLGLGRSSAKPAREGHAEAKLTALHAMLREDVVAGLEGLLTRVSSEPDPEAKASLYYEGVCAALAACKRLADVDGSAAAAAGGAAADPSSWAEAEALELERLRRDLADAKVALAESEAKREAAAHTALKASEQQRKSRSIFG